MAKKAEVKKDTLVSSIKGMVDDAIALTGSWEQKNLKWNKMRYGIKKEKNFPFVGCSNIRMPTIETKLRKLKAALVNVIFGIRPIVQVVPTPSGNWQSALKVEKFLDHLIMDVIKLKGKAVIAIDQTLEKGFHILKPYWNTNIINRVENLDIKDLTPEEAQLVFDPNLPPEKLKQLIAKNYDVDMSDLVAKENGEQLDKIIQAIAKGDKKIDVSFQDVICNYPDVALCEPERIYVPTDSGYHPESCSWVIHEFNLPVETLEVNSKYKKWDIGDIVEKTEEQKSKADRLAGTSRDADIDGQKDTREGISVLEKTGKVRIWEYYGWFDINGDGADEKCVITIAPDFDKVIRKIALPFYSGKYPFVKTFYELTDDRWFSHRGIPEIIEDIVKEIDMQHNMKLDSQTMRNAPMYIHRAGRINKNTMQFAWGQSMPVSGMEQLTDIIAPLNNNNPNVEFSYEREQMLLEGRVEELIGQSDFTLQSMINKRQPRTLGEVGMQQQSMQNIFSLDADLFRQSFEELFNWIWELWCQYGDEKYEFAYFGQNGYEPIKLTKEETQGKYKITVRGNDQNTNPQIRLQKANMILMMQENPAAMQSGAITPQNLANGIKRAYQLMDIDAWEELVTMPAPPQKPTLDQIAPAFKPKFEDLTQFEQAQVIGAMGMQPDTRGRRMRDEMTGKEHSADIQNKKADTISKVAKATESMDKPENPDTKHDVSKNE